MAQVLRIQADQMRIRRRQFAEEEAHKAPIKMLIPMALLIFPALCVVLMTPAALIMLESGLGAFGG
jgi:tight adherence protein C